MSTNQTNNDSAAIKTLLASNHTYMVAVSGQYGYTDILKHPKQELYEVLTWDGQDDPEIKQFDKADPAITHFCKMRDSFK